MFRINDPKCNFCCVAFQHHPSPELCEGCCVHLCDKKYIRGTQEFHDHIADELDKKLLYHVDGSGEVISRSDLRWYSL